MLSPREGPSARVREREPRRRLLPTIGLLVTAGWVTGCASQPEDAGAREVNTSTTAAPSTRSGSPSAPTETAPPATTVPVEVPPAYEVSDGAPADSALSIPALGITDLEVRAYEGWTDDAPGHAIQNTGIAASPHGPRGGTGPGGIGNYQVTGHRNSAGGVFLTLPELSAGDRVVVRAEGVEYVYSITGTRITSFRSERSLREQRAAVPGFPGRTATEAMITLSTCRTQEDHAEGNYWSDEFDNPENRIDKIGVLVRTRPA